MTHPFGQSIDIGQLTTWQEDETPYTVRVLNLTPINIDVHVEFAQPGNVCIVTVKPIEPGDESDQVSATIRGGQHGRD